MKDLVVPWAAIRHRRTHAALIFATSAFAFALLGIAASLNSSLQDVAASRHRSLALNAATVMIVMLGLGMMFALTSSAISQSVRTHIKDLAVLKAIGFSSGRIILFIFWEAAIPSGAAAMLGLAIAVPIANRILHTLPKGDLVPSPHLTPTVLGLAVGVAILGPLISVLIPASRAVRLNVAATLSR